MKKLIYTLALVVLGITSSNAQEPGKRKPNGNVDRDGKENMEGRRKFERNGDDKLTPEQRAEKAANQLQKRLTLSEDQKQKVQQIELDRIRKSDEWRKQDDKAMRGKMEERKSFMNSSREKMDKILTEEQRKTLTDSHKDLKKRMKGNRGERPTPPSPAKNN